MFSINFYVAAWKDIIITACEHYPYDGDIKKVILNLKSQCRNWENYHPCTDKDNHLYLVSGNYICCGRMVKYGDLYPEYTSTQDTPSAKKLCFAPEVIQKKKDCQPSSCSSKLDIFSRGYNENSN